MRSDITVAYPFSTSYRKRALTVIVYPITEAPLELLNETASGGTTITDYIESMTQSESGAEIRMTLPSNVTIPSPNQGVTIRDTLTGQTVLVFNGIIASVKQRKVRPAEVSVTLVCRTRDVSPLWRSVKRVSDPIYRGQDSGLVARMIAANAGLDTTEYSFPDTGATIPLGYSQMADLSFWDMVEACAAPALQQVFCDCRGQFKFISRDVNAKAALVYTDNTQIVDIEYTQQEAPVTRVRVKYQDPIMEKVHRAEQVLSTKRIQIGWYNPNATEEIWFSEDRKLRADDTRFQIVRSANEGALNFGYDEAYSQVSPFGGRITVTGNAFLNYTLMSSAVSAFLAACALPEAVIGTVVATTAPFSPKTMAMGAALALIVAVLSNEALGEYQIHGRPYEYVSRVNTAEAYDINAPTWSERVDEIESQFITNEDQAWSLAINELRYRSLSSNRAAMTVLDDYRLEPGDIILLADGRRFYTQGYSRNLSRGAEALLRLDGFFV